MCENTILAKDRNCAKTLHIFTSLICHIVKEVNHTRKRSKQCELNDKKFLYHGDSMHLAYRNKAYLQGVPKKSDTIEIISLFLSRS